MKYYEVVLEGHEKAMHGLLEGFMLGSSVKCEYYFSSDWGIKTETLMEAILEWISLKAKLHHVVMNDSMLKALQKAVKTKKDLNVVNKDIIKSAKTIKKASFTFEAKTYGKKYGDEIKAMLKKIPKGLKLSGFKPVEQNIADAKGAELYAPDHDYIFEGEGTVTGPVKEVIQFRKQLDDYPLIKAGEIELKL